MSCIAWDGKTLAADCQLTSAGLRRMVNKIHQIGEAAFRVLFGAAGEYPAALALENWVREGRDKDRFPYSLVLDKDGQPNARLLVISFDLLRNVDTGELEVAPRLQLFEGCPYPALLLNNHFAMGSGRDYAMAAMHLGKTAREAVAVACHFDVYCGGGIDSISAPGPAEMTVRPWGA